MSLLSLMKGQAWIGRSIVSCQYDYQDSDYMHVMSLRVIHLKHGHANYNETKWRYMSYKVQGVIPSNITVLPKYPATVPNPSMACSSSA